jgi:phosphohistidine swiveling domain-containing protein
MSDRGVAKISGKNVIEALADLFTHAEEHNWSQDRKWIISLRMAALIKEAAGLAATNIVHGRELFGLPVEIDQDEDDTKTCAWAVQVTIDGTQANTYEVTS